MSVYKRGSLKLVVLAPHQAHRERLQIWVSAGCRDWLRNTRGDSTIQGGTEEIVEQAYLSQKQTSHNAHNGNNA